VNLVVRGLSLLAGTVSSSNLLPIELKVMNVIYLAEIINLFIQLRKQERFLELMKNEKRYQTFLQELLRDSRYFKPEVMVRISGAKREPEHLYKDMVRLGAGPKCYVVSEDDEQDGKVEGLRTALERVSTGMSEILIYCWHGQVAYYKGPEEFGLILRKAAPG
jgi:hypothetical protein